MLTGIFFFSKSESEERARWHGFLHPRQSRHAVPILLTLPGGKRPGRSCGDGPGQGGAARTAWGGVVPLGRARRAAGRQGGRAAGRAAGALTE